jgi:putative oxidoreductase
MIVLEDVLRLTIGKEGLMDIGLLVVRAVIGLILFGHGAQKFGWFGGPGLTTAGQGLESLGYRPGRFFAMVAGATEAGGGLLLALGLLTPLAAAAIMGTMLNAALSAHVKNGFWGNKGGYEYTLALGGVAAGLAFTGAGAYSLDHAAGWNLGGTAWGVFAVALALGIGMATDLYRRRTLAVDRRSSLADPSAA